MNLRPRLIAAAYPAVKTVNALRGVLQPSFSKQLRVLVYHDIQTHQTASFEEQLRWVARSWEFVSPDRFAAMLRGDEPVTGRHVLLTFDDGFASHRHAAEHVLTQMKIKALFFVVSDFVNLSNTDEARAFVLQRVFPGVLPARLAFSGNMRWHDLEALLEQGHTIGGHTRTHARLSWIDDERCLREEIVGSADLLSARLGTPVQDFAYPFGYLSGFSPVALKIAQQRYRTVYSVLRGNNIGQPAHAIARDGFYPDDDRQTLGFFLEGAGDFRYRDDLEQLARWTCPSP